MMPNGMILKPARPLAIPDYLIFSLDTKKILNGTTEYESWTIVSGTTFGMILAYAEFPNPNATFYGEYHLKHYHFQKRQQQRYQAAIVQFVDGVQSLWI